MAGVGGARWNPVSMWRKCASVLFIALVALFLLDAAVRAMGGARVACGLMGYQMTSGPGGIDVARCHPVD